MTAMPTERFMPSAPPTPSSLPNGDVHVWCADADQPWPEALLYGVLSEEERARAGSFAFEEDRRRYAHAHGVLRLVLGHYLDRTPRSIRLTTGRNGKPCLPWYERAVHFNISHARALMLCAFARDRQVGVDVEWRDRELSWGDLAVYTCSDREQVILSSLDGPAQVETFVTWWTLKEAYVKALGVGLDLPLNRIDVADAGETRYAVPIGGDIRDPRWAMFTLPMGVEYAGALVTEERPSRVRCFSWSWSSDAISISESAMNGQGVEEHDHAHQL